MATYAEIDSNNIVLRLVHISNDEIRNNDDSENDELGKELCKKSTNSDNRFIKTSINNNIRERCAQIGGLYLEDLDIYTVSQPYPSWTFNIQKRIWDAPVEHPPLTEEQIQDRYFYEWSEEDQKWNLKRNQIEKIIVDESFRSQLTFTEKLLWDSPDTASTLSQKAAITTFKIELPLTIDMEENNEFLDLLVSEGVYTQERLDEIISNL